MGVGVAGRPRSLPHPSRLTRFGTTRGRFRSPNPPVYSGDRPRPTNSLEPVLVVSFYAVVPTHLRGRWEGATSGDIGRQERSRGPPLVGTEVPIRGPFYKWRNLVHVYDGRRTE